MFRTASTSLPSVTGKPSTVDAETIADLIAAYRLLEADAEADERFWF